VHGFAVDNSWYACVVGMPVLNEDKIKLN
jgi:hypothetical protein